MLKAIKTKSPGRINIIGEHTDYNDGFVLPAAIDKATIVHLKKNESPSECSIIALNIGEVCYFDLNNFQPVKNSWENYLKGVVHELQKLGAKFTGFDCEFGGNVPIGSGMSSSASLECSFAFALNELFELGFDKWQLIKASQLAEHNFVGIKCGIMDQFASMMGKQNQVMLLDCRTLEFEYFPLELGAYQLLLLDTNVAHSLADSAYNNRRTECKKGVAIIQQKYPKTKKLRDVSLTQLSEFSAIMPAETFKRCRHVISENQRVLEATEALKQKNYTQLGKLIYQSHNSLKEDYEVSCPELDFLVNLTLEKDYVLGSRMMGGGFGGSTISILKKNMVNIFKVHATKAYKEKFGRELTPYTISIEDGAKVIN